MSTTSEALRAVAADGQLMYEVGRRAVEDVLVDWRDASLSILGRRNGLVINSRDGEPSSVIRMSVEDAVRIAMEAMADHLEKKAEVERGKTYTVITLLEDTPDYKLGFEHGADGRKAFSSEENYIAGWAAGYAARRESKEEA